MPKVPLCISFPGTGVLVYWQIGVLKGLSQHVDLARAPMLGSSSGALAVALAKSGACLDSAAHRGVELLKEFRVSDRALGVVGILSRITNRWLQDVLPDAAGARCSNGTATLLVTTLPFMRVRGIDSFACKQDLISVVLASSHIPLIMDWRMFVTCRRQPVIDGGVWWWLQRRRDHYHPPHARSTLLVQPADDPHIVKDLSRLKRMRPTDLGLADELIGMGVEHAQRLVAAHGDLLAHYPLLHPCSTNSATIPLHHPWPTAAAAAAVGSAAGAGMPQAAANLLLRSAAAARPQLPPELPTSAALAASLQRPSLQHLRQSASAASPLEQQQQQRDRCRGHNP